MMEVITSVASDTVITDVCFIISRYITQKNNLLTSDAMKIEPNTVVFYYILWFDFYCIRRYYLGPFLWHFIKSLSTLFDLKMSRSFSEQTN